MTSRNPSVPPMLSPPSGERPAVPGAEPLEASRPELDQELIDRGQHREQSQYDDRHGD